MKTNADETRVDTFGALKSPGGETYCTACDGALDTKLPETVITGETMSMTEYGERGYTEEYFELTLSCLGFLTSFKKVQTSDKSFRSAQES